MSLCHYKNILHFVLIPFIYTAATYFYKFQLPNNYLSSTLIKLITEWYYCRHFISNMKILRNENGCQITHASIFHNSFFGLSQVVFVGVVVLEEQTTSSLMIGVCTLVSFFISIISYPDSPYFSFSSIIQGLGWRPVMASMVEKRVVLSGSVQNVNSLLALISLHDGSKFSEVYL
jgi:hypothetical protein